MARIVKIKGKIIPEKVKIREVTDGSDDLMEAKIDKTNTKKGVKKDGN